MLYDIYKACHVRIKYCCFKLVDFILSKDVLLAPNQDPCNNYNKKETEIIWDCSQVWALTWPRVKGNRPDMHVLNKLEK